MAKVYVMIFDWLKKAAISNVFEDHDLKLEYNVFKRNSFAASFLSRDIDVFVQMF